MARAVYLAGAIKGDTKFEFAQAAILDAIRAGAPSPSQIRVWSEKSDDVAPIDETKGPKQVFRRDQIWLEHSDALIAEVSGESFGTGWEIAYAQKVRLIPVLCLAWLKAAVPAMIAGNLHKGIHLETYEDEMDIRRHVLRFVRHQVGIDVADERIPTESRRIHSEPAFQEAASGVWIEGNAQRDGYVLSLCTYLKKGAGIAFDRMMDVFSTHCNQGSIEKVEFENDKTAFRHVTQRLRNLRRAVLICEVSKPSTDLGWLACYAQWHNVQTLALYPEGTNVSWLILGQESSDLIFRSGGQAKLWRWTPKTVESQVDTQHRERPPITGIGFDSESELLQKVDLAFDVISRDYRSHEVPEEYQRVLSEFARDANRDLTPLGDTRTQLRFLAECAVRDALWQDVTASGIEGTFLSGERSELISLLKFHNYSPSPHALYRRIRHAVNYEEKAFAKNVRALKDIGILLKLPAGDFVPTPVRSTDLGQFGVELATKGRQAFITEFDRSLSFVGNQLVLTRFGQDLSDYIAGRPHRSVQIAELLTATRSELIGVLDSPRLSRELVGRMEYLFDTLAEDVKSMITAVVVRSLARNQAS